MAADTIVTGSKLTAIADAVRQLTGQSNSMTLDQIAAAIDNYSPPSGGDEVWTHDFSSSPLVDANGVLRTPQDVTALCDGALMSASGFTKLVATNVAQVGISALQDLRETNEVELPSVAHVTDISKYAFTQWFSYSYDMRPAIAVDSAVRRVIMSGITDMTDEGGDSTAKRSWLPMPYLRSVSVAARHLSYCFPNVTHMKWRSQSGSGTYVIYPILLWVDRQEVHSCDMFGFVLPSATQITVNTNIAQTQQQGCLAMCNAVQDYQGSADTSAYVPIVLVAPNLQAFSGSGMKFGDSDHTRLGRVKAVLPALQNISPYTFYHAGADIVLPSDTTMTTLESNGLYPLSTHSALMPKVYVPTSMLATYQADSSWATQDTLGNLRAIESYPSEVQAIYAYDAAIKAEYPQYFPSGS